MAFFHGNDFMLQTPVREDDSNHPSTSRSPMLHHHQSCNNPQEFLGSIANGSSSHIAKQRSFIMPLDITTTGFNALDQETNNANHIEDELSDDGSQLGGEKKRRLNIDQVKALEKSFELGNKLEPERKMQLALALGLQPRQIAIWFQNRRARWKTKQLERDYEVLKRQFDAVKAENQALHAESQKLHAEILALKRREPTESINLNKETEGSCSNKSDNSLEIKFDISRSNTNHDPNRSLLFPSFLIRQQQQPNNNNNTNSNGGGVDQTSQVLLRPDQNSTHHHHNHHHAVKEESSSLCNMFCGVDDHSGLWPWLADPQHYN